MAHAKEPAVQYIDRHEGEMRVILGELASLRRSADSRSGSACADHTVG
jgi:hypothetical protein